MSFGLAGTYTVQASIVDGCTSANSSTNAVYTVTCPSQDVSCTSMARVSLSVTTRKRQFPLRSALLLLFAIACRGHGALFPCRYRGRRSPGRSRLAPPAPGTRPQRRSTRGTEPRSRPQTHVRLHSLVVNLSYCRGRSLRSFFCCFSERVAGGGFAPVFLQGRLRRWSVVTSPAGRGS